MEKVCKKCGQSKDEGEFPKMWGWRGRDGKRRSVCKKCKKAYERGIEKKRSTARAVAGVSVGSLDEDRVEAEGLPPSGVPDGTIVTNPNTGKPMKWSEKDRTWSDCKLPKEKVVQ